MGAAWKSAAIVGAGAIAAAMLPAALAAAPLCDEYNPAGPAGSARVELNSTDFLDAAGTEIRSFIATDSIGRVDVRLVAATPRGIVRGVSAVPEISMLSPNHGERLKGINVAVSLAPTQRPVSVVLDLRQVCAKHFRNTFLYY